MNEQNFGAKGINIIISSTVNNIAEAERIRMFLIDKFELNVRNETLGFQSMSKNTISELYTGLDENTFVLALISRDYLQNEPD